MAKLVLLNSTLDQTAGSKFDDVTEVTLIARLRSAGGVFVADGEFAIAESAALRSVRAGAGAADATMVAAAAEDALARGKTNATAIAANAAAIAALGPSWSGSNIIFFGKHGDDANDGSTYAKAKLTITSALAAAAAATPGPNNRQAVYSEDGGSYVENLNVPEWTGIIGLASLIQGNHTLGDNALIQSFRLVATSGTAITKAAGAGAATVNCQRMILTGNANGVVCNSGVLNYYGQSISVENGIGVGDGSTGSINAHVNQIEVSGTGHALRMDASGHMHFTGGIDAPGGVGIYVAGTATIGALVDHLDAATAYNVLTGATLNMLAANVTGSRLGSGTKNVTIAGVLEQQTQELTFALPLTGVVDNFFNFLGEFRPVALALIADYTTDFPVGNNHLSLNFHSITGTGTVTITGTEISESTAVPVAGTEDITVDATGRYQSDKKWLEVTNIQVLGAGLTAANYDVEIIGYPDLGNANFRIVGYRLEAYAAGISARLGFDLYKVQDDGNKKWTLVQIESIGVREGAVDEQVDSFRTLANDRSFTAVGGSIWPNDTTYVFKQLDFDTFFSADENIFESATKNEGFVMVMRGEDGAGGGTINQVDFIQFFLRVGTVL